MPTGYTADVQSGKVTEFNEFALGCARAFGACVTMRDDPAGAPIPDKFEPSSYNAEQLKVSTERLAKLQAMTPAQATDAAHQDYKERSKRKREYEAERAEQKARYQAMIVKVTAWHPPTSEHIGLKDFMLQQLRESIAGDCSGQYWEEVTPLDGPAWLAREIANATRDVNYHTKADREERARADQRTAWVRELRASLSPPADTP